MNISRTISALTQAIREYSEQRKHEFEWFKSYYRFATKQDLKEMEQRIMSAISDYAGRVTVAFDKIGTAVDGLVDDVAYLKEEIVKLQNSPGPITPEDQATLDGLEARATTAATALEALDAATARPPTPPPA